MDRACAGSPDNTLLRASSTEIPESRLVDGSRRSTTRSTYWLMAAKLRSPDASLQRIPPTALTTKSRLQVSPNSQRRVFCDCAGLRKVGYHRQNEQKTGVFCHGLGEAGSESVVSTLVERDQIRNAITPATKVRPLTSHAVTPAVSRRKSHPTRATMLGKG